MVKLNLGCGTDIREGWVNLDAVRLPGVDVVHDVRRLPLPFPDEKFEEILCQDILEHIEYIPVLKDIHRILKHRGRLVIRVPHFTSRGNFIDPTHRKMFSVRTFDFFVPDLNLKRPYYFDFSFSRLVSTSITFETSSRLYFYNKFITFFINQSRRVQDMYESTFLSRLFPAQNIMIILEK